MPCEMIRIGMYCACQYNLPTIQKIHTLQQQKTKTYNNKRRQKNTGKVARDRFDNLIFIEGFT